MLVRFDGRRPALRPHLEVIDDDSQDLTLDARDLIWASPADLTGLAAWAAATPARKRLILPSEVDTGCYLRRMDLLQVVEQHGATIEGRLPAETRQDLEHRLIEVSRNDGDSDIETFVAAVFRLVEANVGEREAIAVHRILGELLDNIPHAHSAVGAYGAAQVYSGQTSGDSGIEVSVSDPGRGVLASLRDNPIHQEIRSCAEAIQAAFRIGVTGETVSAQPDSAIRGVGLSEVVRRLSDPAGLLLLRSGDGLGRLTSRSRHFRTTQTSSPGTWAWLRLKPAN